MKILVLGNSNDKPSDEVAESQLRHKLLEPRLSAALGEPVEVHARMLWPTPDAAEIVEGWMRRYAPDVVHLKTNSFWFNHESVPLRLERMLGPLGVPTRNMTMRANSTGWLAHNRVFRTVRDFGRRRIDGAYHYEPEEVVRRVSECIRVIIRSEGVELLVQSSLGKRDTALTERARVRREKRRLEVHAGLQRICSELHVQYLGSDRPLHLDLPPRDPSLLQADAFHRNAKGHRDDVEDKFQILLPVCRRAIEARGVRTT